jgi:hypothetical protein
LRAERGFLSPSLFFKAFIMCNKYDRGGRKGLEVGYLLSIGYQKEIMVVKAEKNAHTK